MVTMIELVQFAPAFGLPNASRFCMKMETCLRMAGLPFELVNSGDVMKAPKHKLPYIDDGGTIVADTSFIMQSGPPPVPGDGRVLSTTLRLGTAAVHRIAAIHDRLALSSL